MTISRSIPEMFLTVSFFDSERVALLIHILRWQDFRKRPDGQIDADELRSAVSEVRRTKMKEKHQQILDEMLRVVEFEERYWRGEIGS